MYGLVEKRETDLGEVDGLDLEGAVRGGEFVEPARDHGTDTTWPGASDDHLEGGFGHQVSLRRRALSTPPSGT
jgi:hypothetical protein